MPYRLFFINFNTVDMIKQFVFLLGILFGSVCFNPLYGRESVQDKEKHIAIIKLKGSQSEANRSGSLDMSLPREKRISSAKFAAERAKDMFLKTLPLQSREKIVGSFWIGNMLEYRVTDLDELEELRNRPEVEYVCVDTKRKIMDFVPRPVTGAASEVAGHLEMLHSVEANEMGYSGEGVVVGLIDSGVNYNHSDLRHAMWQSDKYPNHGWDFYDDDDDPMDELGHGTHCAGIIAGNGASGIKTGVAPDVRIMALKVTDSNGEATQADAIEAIQFAVENGADILSMSLGWPDASDDERKMWRDVMTGLLGCNVLAVVAAGNEGHMQSLYPVPGNIRTPGDCPPAWLAEGQADISEDGISSVMTVGAVGNDGVTLVNVSARGPVTWQGVDGYNDFPFNPGQGLSKPDISAPGLDVISLDYADTYGYTGMTGTSMACPCVTGIAADMLSKNKGLTPSDIVKIISGSSAKISDGFSNDFGAGRADALFATLYTPNSGLDCISAGSYEGQDLSMPLLKPGEETVLSFCIENMTGEDVYDYVVEVVPLTDNVTAEVLAGGLPAIEAGGQTLLKDVAKVTASVNASGGEEVRIMFVVRYGDKTCTNMFTTEVGRPELSAEPLKNEEVEGDGNGRIDAGEKHRLTLAITNNGNEPCTDAVVSFYTESPYVEIVETPSGKTDITGTVQFELTVDVSRDTPDFYTSELFMDLKSDNADTTFVYTVNVGKTGMLVVDRSMSDSPTSAEMIASAIERAGYISYELVREMPDDLSTYHSVWYCAGVYPTNRNVTDAELRSLENFVEAGGNLYMEGGDVWYARRPDVNTLFHVNPIADDGGALGNVTGCLEYFNDREIFGYTSDYQFIDHIEPADGSAVVLYRNVSPSFTVAVGRRSVDGSGATIASSVEAGGTMSSGNGMLVSCMKFFGLDMVEMPETEEVYFFRDFQDDSDTDGFVFYDRDGQEPHFTMSQAGFEKGVAWARMRDGMDYSNYYMASTSKYEGGDEARPSDDWMVTPAISIGSDIAVLSWRAIVPDQWTERDGYAVYLSESGNSPEDFTTSPLFVTDAESSEDWVVHSVSLEGYRGKQIYIAFVNNSHNKYMLAVDDIEVTGTKTLALLRTETPAHLFGENSLRIKACLTAMDGSRPVTEVKAYCKTGDKMLEKSFSGFSLAAGQEFFFSFDELQNVAYGDTLHYELWAEADGRETEHVTGYVSAYPFRPAHRIVVEEATGMWCSYCPQGAVALDALAGKYPDNFIGIAIHYDDAFEQKAYSDALGFLAWPSARVNRTETIKSLLVAAEDSKGKFYTIEGSETEKAFLRELARVPECDIAVEAAIDGGKVNVSASVTPVTDLEGKDFRMVYVLLEEFLCDDSFYQMNSYAGSKYEIGGFENMPERIVGRDIVFNHVARGIWPSVEGEKGSLPSSMTCGVTYDAGCVVDMPSYVMYETNVNVVAMIVDAASGKVVNSALWHNPLMQSVSDGQKDGNASGIRLVVDGGYCTVYLPENVSGRVTANVVAADGRVVVSYGAEACDGMFRIPVGGLKGVYLLNVKSDRSSHVLKVCL